MFAASFAPRTWWYCDGSILAIRSNTALFSILGNTYGGDGITTFALPDLRGRVAVGSGTAVTGTYYQLGQKAGTDAVTLTVANLPAHVHTGQAAISLQALSEGGTASSPTNAHFSAKNGMYVANSAGHDTNLSPIKATVQDAISGGSLPLPLVKPSLGMNYIICLTGVFPYRN